MTISFSEPCGKDKDFEIFSYKANFNELCARKMSKYPISFRKINPAPKIMKAPMHRFAGFAHA